MMTEVAIDTSHTLLHIWCNLANLKVSQFYFSVISFITYLHIK